MISIKGLLGIIFTEAIMYGGMSEEQWIEEGCPIPERAHDSDKSPSMQYNLELLEGENGILYWVE